MEIRPLVADDAAGYRALRLRALREEPDAFGSSYGEEAGWPLDEVKARIRGGAGSFVLGAFDPALIGLVGFARSTREKTRHKGTLWGLYVAPEARGRGVARALVGELIARAKEEPGLEQITLTVGRANEAARALYASLWFTSFGVEHRALLVDGRYLDLEYMALRVG